MLAPYAKTETSLTLLIGGVITIAVGVFFHWWALLPALLALALLMFYRDPPRTSPLGDNLLLSPADGKIMKIERDYGGDEGRELRIVIFLSVFNVHINRSPCAGRVIVVDYSPGEFLNALKPEATERNENNLVIIEPRPPLLGPVRVKQISGVLAKRIVCTLEPGDHVSAGQRYGMIKLGSQTEVRVPEDQRWELCVKPGDAVRAGLTTLAKLNTDEAPDG